MGTFLPLYYNFLETARGQQQQQQQQQQHSPPPRTAAQTINMVATAFVDPSDPSKLVLTQPAHESTAPSAPVYAANFGEDEVYEDMHNTTGRTI